MLRSLAQNILLFCIVNLVQAHAYENQTVPFESTNTGFSIQKVQIIIYIFVWLVGSIGGMLVIYVILFNTSLKTITNTFLLNLAIADLIFLQGIPFYLTNLVYREWIFSLFICKMYWTFTGVNQFTAIFILTLLAYDRYIAVCRPQRVALRKITSSRKVLVSLWTVSILFMLPIILYSNIETITIESGNYYNNSNYSLVKTNTLKHFKSCTILWPENNLIQLELAFVLYGCLFSFFIPIVLISIFYFSIVVRIRKNRRKLNMKPDTKRKDRRKATVLVLLVIAIYIITYTPFWVFQIFLLTTYVFNQIQAANHRISAHLSSLFQFLVYLNSSLNPFLYAFISEIFRSSFMEAIKCTHNFHSTRHFSIYNSVYRNSIRIKKPHKIRTPIEPECDEPNQEENV